MHLQTVTGDLAAERRRRYEDDACLRRAGMPLTRTARRAIRRVCH